MANISKDRQQFPPIDKLKALMLERKLSMGLTYKDIANAAGVAPEYMRKLMSTKHSSEWNIDVRNSVCKQLGLKTKIVITDMNEDKY